MSNFYRVSKFPALFSAKNREKRRKTENPVKITHKVVLLSLLPLKIILKNRKKIVRWPIFSEISKLGLWKYLNDLDMHIFTGFRNFPRFSL